MKKFNDFEYKICSFPHRHNKLAMDSGEGKHAYEKSRKSNENKIEQRLVKKSSDNLQVEDKLCKDCNESFQIEETRYFTLVRSEPLRSAKVTTVSAGKSHSVILTGNYYYFFPVYDI